MDVKAPVKPGVASVVAAQNPTSSTTLPIHKAPIDSGAAQTQADAQPTLAVASAKPKTVKTSHHPTLAIILTLIVMTVLSTLAIFIYTQS